MADSLDADLRSVRHPCGRPLVDRPRPDVRHHSGTRHRDCTPGNAGQHSTGARSCCGNRSGTHFVAAEQLDFGNYQRIDRAAENGKLEAAPKPPSNCRLFYIVANATPSLPGYNPSIDAMLLAERFEIPPSTGTRAGSLTATCPGIRPTPNTSSRSTPCSAASTRKTESMPTIRLRGCGGRWPRER